MIPVSITIFWPGILKSYRGASALVLPAIPLLCLVVYASNRPHRVTTLPRWSPFTLPSTVNHAVYR